jgi:hypothetical protein
MKVELLASMALHWRKGGFILLDISGSQVSLRRFFEGPLHDFNILVLATGRSWQAESLPVNSPRRSVPSKMHVLCWLLGLFLAC